MGLPAVDTATTIAAAIAFGVWLYVTIASQVRSLTSWRPWMPVSIVKMLVQIGLLPRWTFFAPNPAIFDNHLLMRTGGSAAGLSEWIDVGFFGEWSPIVGLWNPLKKEKKTLSDMVALLAREHRELIRARLDEELIILSVPYISILGLCSSYCEQGALVQFSIARTVGPARNDTEIVFISEVHHV